MIPLRFPKYVRVSRDAGTRVAFLAGSTCTSAITRVSNINLLLSVGFMSHIYFTYHQQEHRLYDQHTGWCNSLVLNRTICEMPYSTLHSITRIHSQQMISNRGNLDAALESFPLAIAYLQPPPSREAQYRVAKWR